MIRSQFPKQSSPLGTIAFVGEAPGPAEVSKGYPMAGASGWLLGEACRQVGIERRACYLSNVLSAPYPGTDFKSACGGAECKGNEAPFCFPVAAGAYLHPDWHHDVRRLWSELAQVKPALTIALGGPATWALVPGGPPQVKRSAGTVRPGYLGPVLTTWNPAAILRGTGARLKPEFTAHLLLAVEHLRDGEIHSRISDRIWLEPSMGDLARFDRHLAGLPPDSALAVDIETANGLIECVGYGAGDLTLAVPWHIDEPGTGNLRHYWRTPEYFIQAWCYQRRWLTGAAEPADLHEAPTDWTATGLEGLALHLRRIYELDLSLRDLLDRVRSRDVGSFDNRLQKVMHNGQYDLTWLLIRGSIPVRGYYFDTRMEHYVLDFEAPKDLGGLAVRYFGLQHKHMASKEEGKRDA